jgi:hypothetical protein
VGKYVISTPISTPRHIGTWIPPKGAFSYTLIHDVGEVAEFCGRREEASSIVTTTSTWESKLPDAVIAAAAVWGKISAAADETVESGAGAATRVSEGV